MSANSGSSFIDGREFDRRAWQIHEKMIYPLPGVAL